MIFSIKFDHRVIESGESESDASFNKLIINFLLVNN